MLRQIQDKLVNFIGDPHMGKKFPDVPLHRRGDREKSQLAKFKQELAVVCHFNIMVGDLFDIFDVPNEVLLDVYHAIKEAAEANPQTTYFMLEGNHDISRQANVIHSFDILTEMCRTLPNVIFVKETRSFLIDDFAMLLCPYSAFKTSLQEVTPFCVEGYAYDLVVGHWDVMPLAGPHNLIPLEELFKVTDLVVTGHEHTFTLIPHGDKLVIKTGSMQPYSHGEDPNGEIYVTHTLEQIQTALQSDPHFYHDKCLRVVLGADEQPPMDIDCLQFAVKRVEGDIAEIYEANLDGEFSFKGIFEATFKEHGLDEATTQKYYDQYKQESNNAD